MSCTWSTSKITKRLQDLKPSKPVVLSHRKSVCQNAWTALAHEGGQQSNLLAIVQCDAGLVKALTWHNLTFMIP